MAKCHCEERSDVAIRIPITVGFISVLDKSVFRLSVLSSQSAIQTDEQVCHPERSEGSSHLFECKCDPDA
jgi:hypothetical protein